MKKIAFICLLSLAASSQAALISGLSASNPGFIRGTFNNWGKWPMQAICAPNNPNWYYQGCSLSYPFVDLRNPDTVAFKFDVYGDWRYNFGDTTQNDSLTQFYPSSVLNQSGSNIKVSVPCPGLYKITLNNTTLLPYGSSGLPKNDPTLAVPELMNGTSCAKTVAFNYPGLFLRGSFNNWQATPMWLVKDNIWELRITLEGVASSSWNGVWGYKHEFKFDRYNDWSVNYGASETTRLPIQGSRTAKQNGGNIILFASNLETSQTHSRSYIIRFNDKTNQYAACGTDYLKLNSDPLCEGVY